MITDSMWNEIEKILPKKKSKVGRPLLPVQRALNGIFYVLKTGIQWKMLLRESGAPSTVYGKFRYWTKIGIFEKIAQKARKVYEKRQKHPSDWFAIDASFSKAPLAKDFSGINPTDRGKRGIKRNVSIDIKGAPLVVSVGPANRQDSIFFEEIFHQLNACDREKVKGIAADSAYDSIKLRNICKKENFVLLASTNRRRNKDKPIYKPVWRRVLERTFAWLAWLV